MHDFFGDFILASKKFIMYAGIALSCVLSLWQSFWNFFFIILQWLFFISQCIEIKTTSKFYEYKIIKPRCFYEKIHNNRHNLRRLNSQSIFDTQCSIVIEKLLTAQKNTKETLKTQGKKSCHFKIKSKTPLQRHWFTLKYTFY